MEPSSSPAAIPAPADPTSAPARRQDWHRHMPKPKPKPKRAKAKGRAKMTKEERRAKYTDQARERRRKHVKRARDKGLVCYRCRRPGHAAEDCPQGGRKGGDQRTTPGGGGVCCYKCGSGEHRIQKCPMLSTCLAVGQGRLDFGKLGDLPFATCYVCGEKGHLAGRCPKSERGLYPDGGACRECGAVDHYAIDCPKRGAHEESAEEGGGDEVSDTSPSIDHYLEDPTTAPQQQQPKSIQKKKVVYF